MTQPATTTPPPADTTPPAAPEPAGLDENRVAALIREQLAPVLEAVQGKPAGSPAPAAPAAGATPPAAGAPAAPGGGGEIEAAVRRVLEGRDNEDRHAILADEVAKLKDRIDAEPAKAPHWRRVLLGW